MGLLDKWTKKQEKEQLEATEKKVEAPVKVAKKTVVKNEKTSKATKVSKKSGVAYKVIVRPIVSEKATTQEMQGKYVETNFTNCDALFMPQDHPARGIHDIFYIKEPQKDSLKEFF